MRKVVASSCMLLVAGAFGLFPSQVLAYGDPSGWCTTYSQMGYASIQTNDPLVGTNPEQDTFYGYYSNPGYDTWWGEFYGDFRGQAGDDSGWTYLLTDYYPNHYHWNFGPSGNDTTKNWQVHGHVRQYIAYYNWTFGGQCGMGYYC